MNSFLRQLNDAQRAAVTHTEGPSLVIAGAGSGKTRVLTYRIAYLLACGVPPSNILALTFTNKAAREMRERIDALVGENLSRYLWMGTFHHVFARILRMENERIGYARDYTIYDANDSRGLIKRIIREMELDEKTYRVAAVAERISAAKNNLLSPLDYAADRNQLEEDRRARMPRIVDLYHLYNRRLRQANAMDFDDLLFNMNLLLQTCPDLREKYCKLFRYILVDEYQDTNYCQARVMTLLAAPDNNICVVGDDAQSIYSFRGANIDNILRFSDTFPGTHIFKLERNYRSTRNIVGAANSLIRKNRGQIPKEVYSENDEGAPLCLFAHENDREEAAFVANRIRTEALSSSVSYSDFAILYRTNAQSRVLEDELRKAGLPYHVYGGVSFYRRKEIKDAVAYFRIIVNSDDDEALLRVINFPARGIGDTTLRKVLDTAHEASVPAFNVVASPDSYALPVSAATKNKLTAFAELISSFRDLIETEDAYQFARTVLSRTSVLTAALAEKSQEGQERYENLQELLGSIHEFVEQRLRQDETFVSIRDFLAEVSLLTDQDERQNDNKPHISLMTVHAAKGLEFPIVFVVGMEDKLFPSMFSTDLRDMEEERRLFYVALTRAGRKVIITHARQRFRNGQIMLSIPSPFLRDIDERFLDRTGEEHKVSFSRQGGRWAEWNERPSRPESFTISQPSAFRTVKAPNPSALRTTTGLQPATGRTPFQSPFSEGTRVLHATFGEGTVLASYKENDNEKIEIRFDSAGCKTLLLKFARLQLLS